MTRLNGLILAGGKSSRMGRDKSLIVFHDQPQRDHLFNILKRFCNEVYLSCKNVEGIPEHLNAIPDKFDLNTPLNGILSAFEHEPSAAWLAVAVDMPFVDALTIKTLIENRDPKKVATCYYDSDGDKPEPLLTIWEPRAYLLLRDFHSRGGFGARHFLMENDIHLITVPDPRALMNVNSEDDIRRLND
ncbi:MAG: NTP transferase domain-containing protein [Bacteroidota bacterium]|jgi:molybdopterin-guanine dinucleotide biosynthesis protein A|nr:MAG: molybdenum cofactor guanylyltransferase [Bacteroidota bacterium]